MSEYNADVRAAAKKAGVYLYDIAFALGVSENTVTRMLRRELPETKKAEIMRVIAEISAKNPAEWR